MILDNYNTSEHYLHVVDRPEIMAVDAAEATNLAVEREYLIYICLAAP